MLHSPCSNALRPDRRLIQEGATFEAVAKEPAVLEPSKQGPNAGILQSMLRSERLADLLGGCASVSPDEIQDGLLKFGEWSLHDATVCHVTVCSTIEASAQQICLRQIQILIAAVATRSYSPPYEVSHARRVAIASQQSPAPRVRVPHAPVRSRVRAAFNRMPDAGDRIGRGICSICVRTVLFLPDQANRHDCRMLSLGSSKPSKFLAVPHRTFSARLSGFLRLPTPQTSFKNPGGITWKFGQVLSISFT